MSAIAAWHEEHSYFKRLLHLMQEEADMLHAGGRPNYELMLDIISYLREYGDRMHHPREDEVFKRLAERAPQLRKVVWRLHQEHRVIAQAGEELAKLLEEAVGDAMMPRSQIEVAAATYIVYYGNHIAREDEEVLPVAASMLSEEDWAAARAQGMAGADPQRGRFRAMRRRIALEAV